MTSDQAPPRPESTTGRPRVLIVDDDENLLRNLKAMMERKGFIVDTATTGEEGLEKAMDGTFDVMVLDAVLPEMHGLEVAYRIRNAGRTTPILMLTGMNSTDFLVEALAVGADDFVGKPFSPKELEARVRALVRRGKVVPELTVGPLLLDPVHRMLSRDGKTERLTGIEVRILSVLATSAGEYVTHADLLKRVWNLDFDPGTNMVYTHVTNLRKKLEALGEADLLESSRGQGYRITTG